MSEPTYTGSAYGALKAHYDQVHAANIEYEMALMRLRVWCDNTIKAMGEVTQAGQRDIAIGRASFARDVLGLLNVLEGR